MKYQAVISGKRLRKETRLALVKIGKEVAGLSEAVAEIIATSGFVYSDGNSSYEIKVARSAVKEAAKEEEL